MTAKPWQIENFSHFHFFCIPKQADSRFNGSLHRLMTLSRSSFLSMFRSPIAFQSITLPLPEAHSSVCGKSFTAKSFVSVYIKFSLFSFSLISVSVYSLSSSLPRSLSISSVGWLLLVFLSVVCVLSALDNKLYPFSHSFRCLLFLLASSLESDSHLWKTCEYSILPFHSHIHCFFNYAQWNLGSFSREFLTM